MTKLARLVAALFALALLAAACSSDDGEETSTDDSAGESSTTSEADEATTTSEADATTTESSEDTDSTTDDGADGDDAAGDAADGDDADGGDADGGADDGGADDGDDSAEAGSGDADDAAVADDAGITILGVSFESGTVTIRNDGDETVDFTGYYTCNRPAYAEMPPETLAPGATLDLDVTELDIRASAGEFGLYSSRSFDSAADMVAYVQWGKPDNGRAGTAVEAGLIAEGEFVDNGGADIVLE